MEQPISSGFPNFSPSWFLPHFCISCTNINVFKPTHFLKIAKLPIINELASPAVDDLRRKNASKLTRYKIGGRVVPWVPSPEEETGPAGSTGRAKDSGEVHPPCRPPAGPTSGTCWPPGWPGPHALQRHSGLRGPAGRTRRGGRAGRRGGSGPAGAGLAACWLLRKPAPGHSAARTAAPRPLQPRLPPD